MSDTTEITELSEPTEAPKRKPLSEDKLKQLQAAREKALEKRRMLAELSRKERQMKEEAIQQRMAKVQQYEKAKLVPSEPVVRTNSKPKLKTHPKKSQPPPPSPETSEEDSTCDATESDSDESVECVPATKPSKKKSTMPMHSHYIAAKGHSQRKTSELTAQIAKEELQRRIARENMEVAFRSLFPNHSLMYN